MQQADIGLIGLAVMGENLVLNLESKGFSVAVYNRTEARTRAFLEGRAAGRKIVPAWSLAGLVNQLRRPRKIMMMVKAGRAVDELIEALLPLLDRGDILIDGGNSHFTDTIRRCRTVEAAGMFYLGCGVSGGEEGALKGPSIMPGGSRAAWEEAAPILTAISAHLPDGSPCCGWVGENGAGHFVKMVHNGIEYGDMQIICEGYHIMRELLGMDAPACASVFEQWNKTELDSYLIEITAKVLARREEDGSPLVDRILDSAGQKGTGKWTSEAALELGVPLTLISEAVFARGLSARKEERTQAAALYGRSVRRCGEEERETILESLRQAVYAAKIVSYAQGFDLLRASAEQYGWELDYGGIALLWRGGCIIRSAFLGDIKAAFDRRPDLPNLLVDSHFQREMERREEGWRAVVARAVCSGLPVPALSSALAYFDSYTCASLPANLLQGQRDYFGAHTYERTDRPRGEFFHTHWQEPGEDQLKNC